MITAQSLDNFIFERAREIIEDTKQDHVPVVISFTGDEFEVHNCQPLMDNREQVGALVNRLVTTPGIDFVCNIAQGYSLQMGTPPTREQAARWALWKLGTPIKDIPGNQEMITVTIYDKTKPQCECWSAMHEVKDWKLTRGERRKLSHTTGRMSAPIPQRQD